MKAAQVVAYGRPVELVEVPEPEIVDPHDVIVRIAGAGICRTDLHILQGELAEAFGATLPYTLGHENAGHVHAVGAAVSHVAPGDPVIVHPAVTCGFCGPCRAGVDMHCPTWRFPGVDGWNGGYGELLRTSARSLVKLPAGTDPAPLAPHSDAGLTAIHAVKRLAPFLHPASSVVVIGAGGVGQVAIQLLKILTPARVIVLDRDPEREVFARSFGADAAHTVGADGGLGVVREETGGLGADAVLDLVGEHDVPAQAMRMLQKGGIYSIVGYGGRVEIEHLDMINRELTIFGNQIGSHTDLVDLMELAVQGRIRLETESFPLDDVADVLHEVDAGRVFGRAVLIP
jgi:D-arabinose 1-dehydrogenase-like Zn-dependent alcohol dehydrogenase